MATTAASTTTGINASGITKIKSSLDLYIKKMQTSISVAANTATIEKAIKGSSSEASLRQMNKDITAELSRLMNSLKEYSTTLDNILASYKSNDTNNVTFTNVSKGINR